MNEDLQRILNEVRTGGMSVEVARMCGGVLYGKGDCSPTDLTKFERSLKKGGRP